MSDEKLKSIKSSLFSRGIKVASLVALSAKSYAKGKLLDSNLTDAEALIEIFKEQVIPLVTQFGKMKGPAMKLGQVLSMYGEIFFPPEINDVFKRLQSTSPPMDSGVIQQVLREQLKEKLDELNVDLEPLASASIGQVHRATRKSDGKKLVLKIQYPNVDEAIASDLLILKKVLQLVQLLPQVSHLDLVFEEVKSMLYQEIDYQKEAQLNQEYARRLANDPSYVIPTVIPEYSTFKVLAMNYEEGLRVDDPRVLNLPIAERNAIAKKFLTLYFRELFEWGMVQTDPHLGNYRIRLSETGNHQLILYDFGAVRKFDAEFVGNYRKMIKAALTENSSSLREYAAKLKFLEEDDSIELKDLFTQFCFDMVEPFNPKRNPKWFNVNGEYVFAKTDLPKRLTEQVSQVIRNYKVKGPPREVVFLDRKTGGVFIFMAVLHAEINGRSMLEKFLD